MGLDRINNWALQTEDILMNTLSLVFLIDQNVRLMLVEKHIFPSLGTSL